MLTFVMAVYGQPLMLEKWWSTIRDYRPEDLAKLHLTIVDDCGDPPVEVPQDIQDMLDCQVLRVTRDIPWNQMGARNLGVQEAQTDWVLMLDPDMVVEPGMVPRLFAQLSKLRIGVLVKPLLRYKNDDLDNSSPNVYLIHRSDFDRAGGYDEDYAGRKGWSDVQLLHTLQGVKVKFQRPDGLWVRYYRSSEIADATVNTLDRSVKHNGSMHLRKMNWIRKNGWAKWAAANRPRRIRFPWVKVI